MIAVHVNSVSLQMDANSSCRCPLQHLEQQMESIHLYRMSEVILAGRVDMGDCWKEQRKMVLLLIPETSAA